MSSVSSGTICRETHLRDQDLVRWLENKLGSSELWGGRQASSMLTREMLVELETCFQELEPATKLKIIQAMAHLSAKILQTWKEPLLNLIELARRDPDDWVEAMADIFRNFPDLGFIQCSSRPDSYFSKTLDELIKLLTKTFEKGANEVQFPLPPDSELMNASTIEATYGHDSLALIRQKHFTLRKQTNKFDKLLADVKKASVQQNNPANRKSHGMLASSFPIKIRSTAKKLDNDLPMKGLSSSTSALKMSTGFTNDAKKSQQRTLLKRVGGAQLLDIAELPQPIRRRRTTLTASAVPSSSATPQQVTSTTGDQPPSMIDAGGQQQQQQQRKNSLNKRPLEKKLADAGISSVAPAKMARWQQNSMEPNKEAETKTAASNGDSPFIAAVSASSATAGPMMDNGGDEQTISAGASSDAALPPHGSVGQLCLTNSNIREQFNNASTSSIHHPNRHQQQMSMRPMVGSCSFSASSSAPVNASTSSTSSTSTCFNNLFTEISDQHNSNSQQSTSMDNNINLGNEALKQLNGLLKDANKLSPLSYNMIASFLSGNKNNPLVDKLGTLITLPLSETVELERAYDGTATTAVLFLVETFFQMNYSTGEWKRLRKSRLLKPEELGKYAHYLHQQGPPLSTTNTNSTMLMSSTPSLEPNFVGGQHFQQQQQHTFWTVQQQQQQQQEHPHQQQSCGNSSSTTTSSN